MSEARAHPGVPITEVAGDGRPVIAAATAITAFVGRAGRGPVDEPVQVTTWSDFERTFGGLWRGSGLGYAVRDFFSNGGSTALIVRVARHADTAIVDLGGLKLRATGPGEWANALSVTVIHPTGAEADAIAASRGAGVAAADLFSVEIREDAAAVAADEIFADLTMVDGPRRVDLVLQESKYLRVGGALGDTRPGEVQAATVTTPGSDGEAPQAEDYVGAPGVDTFAADERGLYALSRADLFTLLCLPPPTPDGDLPGEVWAEALAYCVERRAFLVVDPPVAEGPSTVAAWPAAVGLEGTAARNAAVYFPRVRYPDPLRGDADADFAASGAVCGVIARTDANKGVWKAPAGTDAGLTGATGLAQFLTGDDNGRIHRLGINTLRLLPGTGPVVWGARTARGADELADDYKYIPVRRLALFLEESLDRGTQWVVFEPNDARLCSRIQASVGAFLHNLFQQGAFQGSTPRDAYFVRCDRETTTQDDVDRGIVHVHVGFAPLKPAEFLVVSIQRKTAGDPE